MTPKQVFQNIQNQPETTRKVILWGVTISLGVLLLAWWFADTKSKFQNRENPSLREQLQLESLEENLQNIPENLNGGQ
ncbi:MAG TPA: hypothetical protein VGA53_00570 [Candidatus Paceibacterota bacterium]